MIIRGRVQDGVVVLEPGTCLPDGTEVTIIPRAESEPPAERMSDEHRQALRETRRHFESLPNEHPGDTFTGADHDRVLYGDGR